MSPISSLTSQAINDLTWAMVAQGNAQHAIEHAKTTQRKATELLRRNGAIAAAAIRELSDAQLDLAAPNSLHGHAPVTRGLKTTCFKQRLLTFP